MILTKEILEQIERALSLSGVKDTHFEYAQFPLTMKERIPIIQNGRNRLLDITSLANSVLLHKDTHFINVSFTDEGLIVPYILEKAIRSIPLENARMGQVLTFFDIETEQWVIYQFKGKELKNFYDETKWEKLLPNHFKGFFKNETALLDHVPKPDIGDYAYVRSVDPPGYFLYECQENHKWVNVGELAKLIADIEITGDIKISDHNTWVIDGVDTGIGIYPKEIYWEQIADRPATWDELSKMLDGDYKFALKDHTHKIEDVEGLSDILNQYQVALSNKADKNHNHDDRYSNLNHDHNDKYAKKDIDSAVRNMMDSDGNPLFNPDGIVIPKTSGGGGGGEGGSCDIDIITTGDDKAPTNSNVYSALKTISMFLRKDRPEVAQFKIDFLDGITIGDFIDSLVAGKGAAIDKLGNAQVESLEVRSFLKVFELIYNRLEAIEGDAVFTESGIVEKIIDENQGEQTLLLRKRWEGDFHSFQKDDVIRGVVNNLSTTGEYYTAWARVTHVDVSANTITVVPYNDHEVPAQKNFPITEFMTLNRWGNAINKSRQSTWYLSSPEGRISFLSGVTKPIVEDYNYASFWGKPVPLKIFEGKPINYDQPYAYMRGLMVQDLIRVDYNGEPIKTIVNLGPWKKGEIYRDGSKPPYIQHDVTHLGCIWRCVVDMATEEPRFNSSQWTVISDNTRFKVELYTDAPLIYRANSTFKYRIEAKVLHGTEDISDTIREIDWEWLRFTGNDQADSNWNMLHENSTNSITITQNDMGDPESGTTIFKCQVYIRDGEHKYKVNKDIKL